MAPPDSHSRELHLNVYNNAVGEPISLLSAARKRKFKKEIPQHHPHKKSKQTEKKMNLVKNDQVRTYTYTKTTTKMMMII